MCAFIYVCAIVVVIVGCDIYFLTLPLCVPMMDRMKTLIIWLYRRPLCYYWHLAYVIRRANVSHILCFCFFFSHTLLSISRYLYYLKHALHTHRIDIAAFDFEEPIPLIWMSLNFEQFHCSAYECQMIDAGKKFPSVNLSALWKWKLPAARIHITICILKCSNKWYGGLAFPCMKMNCMFCVLNFNFNLQHITVVDTWKIYCCTRFGCCSSIVFAQFFSSLIQ